MRVCIIYIGKSFPNGRADKKKILEQMEWRRFLKEGGTSFEEEWFKKEI